MGLLSSTQSAASSLKMWGILKHAYADQVHPTNIVHWSISRGTPTVQHQSWVKTRDSSHDALNPDLLSNSHSPAFAHNSLRGSGFER